MATATSLEDAEARLSRVVASAEPPKNGRPVAVLMSVDELESLEETSEIRSDPDAMADM